MWQILHIKLILFLTLLMLCHGVSTTEKVTTSKIQRSTTKTINSLITTDYQDFSTSVLPIINLFPRDGNIFDYIVEIGENNEPLGLRLDIAQGDIWVPASSEFPECDVSPSFYTRTTIQQYTSFSVPSDPIETVITVYTTYPESTATSVISATSYVVNMVEPVYLQYCASLGVFDLLSSSSGYFIDLATKLITTVQNATEYFKLYINLILVTGVWVADDITVSFRNSTLIEDIRFSNVPFVYANFSEVSVGALALGTSQDTDYGYQFNFISNFVANQIIKSNSYSLALNAYNYTSPELILGGVNPSYIYTPEGGVNRFDAADDRTGLMTLLDFVPIYDDTGTIISSNDGYSDSILAIAMFDWGVTSAASGQSLTFAPYYNDKTGTGNYPRGAVLDSRSRYNYIPYSTLVELAVELNAIYNVDSDRWVVDCSVATTGTIDLNLGNYTVNMPISAMLYTATFNDTNLVFTSGDSACYLAFLPDYKIGYSLLGTPFLKSIYLAVDNENKQLAISQCNSYVNDLGTGSIFDPSNQSSCSDGTIKTSQISSDKSSMDSAVVVGTTTTMQLQDGYTTLQGVEESLKYTVTSEIISNSHTSTKVITYSNLHESVVTDEILGESLYAIQSGTIPFARRYATVNDVTVTIPRTIVLTDTDLQSTQAVISNGELIYRTRNIVDDGHTKGGGSATDTETQTNYGFSSLVSVISTHTASAIGSNIHVPDIFNAQTVGGLKSILYTIYGAILITVCAFFL